MALSPRLLSVSPAGIRGAASPCPTRARPESFAKKPVGTVAVLLAASACLACVVQGAEEKAAPAALPAVSVNVYQATLPEKVKGVVLPEVVLPRTDGKTFRLSDYRGKVLLVHSCDLEDEERFLNPIWWDEVVPHRYYDKRPRLYREGQGDDRPAAIVKEVETLWKETIRPDPALDMVLARIPMSSTFDFVYRDDSDLAHLAKMFKEDMWRDFDLPPLVVDTMDSHFPHLSWCECLVMDAEGRIRSRLMGITATDKEKKGRIAAIMKALAEEHRRGEGARGEPGADIDSRGGFAQTFSTMTDAEWTIDPRWEPAFLYYAGSRINDGRLVLPTVFIVRELPDSVHGTLQLKLSGTDDVDVALADFAGPAGARGPHWFHTVRLSVNGETDVSLQVKPGGATLSLNGREIAAPGLAAARQMRIVGLRSRQARAFLHSIAFTPTGWAASSPCSRPLPPERQVGKGKIVGFDAYYSYEWPEEGSGHATDLHPLVEMPDAITQRDFGYVRGFIESTGGSTVRLQWPATRDQLDRMSMYVVSLPTWNVHAEEMASWRKDRPYQVFDEAAIDRIETWVNKGGVLVLLSKTRRQPEFDSLNRLSRRFGITFNHDGYYGKGRIEISSDTIRTNLGRHPVLRGASVDASRVLTFTVQEPAEAFLTGSKRDPNAIVMAKAQVGKGMVLAVGEPLFSEDRAPSGVWVSRLNPLYGWENNQCAVRRLVEWLLEHATERGDTAVNLDKIRLADQRTSDLPSLPKLVFTPAVDIETVKQAHLRACNLPSLAGKVRSELTDVFPGKDDTLKDWNGWKETILRFNPAGRLAAVFFLPEKPLNEEAVSWFLTDRCGLTLPKAKRIDSTAGVFYRNLGGRIRTVNMVDVDWSSMGKEIGWIGVFYDIPWHDQGRHK